MIDWSGRPEMQHALRQLWDEGHSTSRIADMINARWPGANATKNSIIGAAHRLQLPARASPIIRNGRTALKQRHILRAGPVTLPALASVSIPVVADKAKTRQPRHPDRVVHVRGTGSVPAQTVALPAVSAPPVSHCQWPLNGGRPWKFCDHKAVVRLNPDTGRVICNVYCDQHFRRAYVSTAKSATTNTFVPWRSGRIR